jgi:hypothetical protein
VIAGTDCGRANFIAMRRRLLVSVFAALLLTGGCSRESPEEIAAREARDVAQVKALQKVHPPLQPIAPQRLTSDDLAEAATLARPRDTPDGSVPDLSNCEFSLGSGNTAPTVLAADAKRAVLKIGGSLVALASDSGSPKLMPGLHAKYVGRKYSVQVSRAPDAVSIRDRFDRVVYEASGTLRCGEAPAR